MKCFQLDANSLWRDRSFTLFWLARTISLAGSAITAVVLPILVFQLTGSAFQTALLATLEVLPYFVFGLFAGALADRADLKRLMVASSVANAVLTGSIPFAAVLGLLSLPQIYIVAVLSMTAFVWFDAANFGALPALVGRERVVEANSIIWSTSTIIGIGGPAVGGLLQATIGPATAISLDALSFALAALVLGGVPHTFAQKAPAVLAMEPAEGSVMRRTFRDIHEGLRFVWRQRLVRALTLLGFGNSLTGGAVTGMLVVYAVRALGLAERDTRIGVLFAAGAVGSLVASLLLPRLSKRFPIGRITLAGLFANVTLLVGVALAPNFGVGLVLYLLWEACYTLVIINGIALRQVVTPDHLQSRVNVTARIIAWGGAPFGAAIGGVVAEFTTIRTAYLVMAVGVALSALIGWFSPLRNRDAMHELVVSAEAPA